MFARLFSLLQKTRRDAAIRFHYSQRDISRRSCLEALAVPLEKHGKVALCIPTPPKKMQL